ncbi:hypothetical protein BT63DRAFT_420900 [Microthyrium microscopicum]|uniref:tRNA-splicing endonuclease subunit Sen2 n=1 Tax=Microthyrium microscopicum TaxID=703497 RepID=A0A6A6ULX6_9PEZI|nr:hypothetical protein BT63DRAFT_420900 [Microthyrium microscopicum]
MTTPTPPSASLRAAKRAQEQQHSPDIRRPRRPNYNYIHRNPLPLNTFPLPAFVPHNPISWLRIAFTVLWQTVSPPSSHDIIYEGYFDQASRSVHVTEPKTIRALWEMGFFGKGILSRSEPNWLDQEKTRLGITDRETIELMRDQRRKERDRMKMDRARAEREAIEEQQRKEAGTGLLSPPLTPAENEEVSNTASEISNGAAEPLSQSSMDPLLDKDVQDEAITAEIVNQEHLQLSLYEAYFLHYGLGSLRLSNMPTASSLDLLTLFRQHSYFPPVSLADLSPDDPFLVYYAVYHHFRSLGWVVRDGIKFSVDYLLYERGLVFSHAAFAVMIIPSYNDPYWKEPGRKPTSMQRRKGSRDWSWFHCINRVQTKAVKTLVLCYVEIPPPDAVKGEDIGQIFGQYRIREFCIKRWSPNRNRGKMLPRSK